MLVLSRKPGERLVVPHCDLVVTVVAIEGRAVWPGISAPEAVAVYREGFGSDSVKRTTASSGSRADRKQTHNGATLHE
jgi:carbon storage regulator CsrA